MTAVMPSEETRVTAGLEGGKDVATAKARAGSSRLRRLLPAGVVGGGGLALLIATVLSNAGNLVFAVTMSRQLGAGRFGAYGSIQGIVTVIVVLTTSVQLAIAHTVASRLSRNARLLLRRPAAGALAAGVGAFVVTAAVSPFLKGYLHLSSLVPVLLLGLVMTPTLAMSVPTGILLGRQRYGVVGASLVAGSFFRVLVGPIFVASGMGLNGALWATVADQLVTYIVVSWALRHEIGSAAGERLSTRLGGATLSLVALSGLSAYTAVDSIFARHFLGSAAAGHYVAASTAARIALFAPMAVALIVFPRFSALEKGDPGERRLLGEALAVTALLSLGAAVVLMAFPNLVVHLMFGGRYASSAPLLRILALAGAALGILGLLVYYHLARSSIASTWPWLGVLATAGVITLASHGSGTQIAWVMVGSTAAVLVATLVTPPWRITLGRERSGVLSVGRPIVGEVETGPAVTETVGD